MLRDPWLGLLRGAQDGVLKPHTEGEKRPWDFEGTGLDLLVSSVLPLDCCVPATYVFTELSEIKGTSEGLDPDPIASGKRKSYPRQANNLFRVPLLVSGVPGMKLRSPSW